ncbi:MAG: hypothetical protein IJ764_03785 [Bacteroidales bacterium]|nr:hypothetical protein [Bacteroidales bacterium]
MKNGSIIKGSIVELDFGSKVKIQVADGSLFIYDISEVQRIEKEEAQESHDEKTAAGQPAQATTVVINNNAGQPLYHHKSPAAAWLWSFFICGAGQMYNGQVGKGFLFMGAHVGFAGASIYQLSLYGNSRDNYYYTEAESDAYLGKAVVYGLVAGLISIISQIDAPVVANRINRTHGYIGFDMGGKARIDLMPTLHCTQTDLALSVPATVMPGMRFNVSF